MFCWMRPAIGPVPLRMPLVTFPGPIMPKAEATKLRRSEVFSLAPFYKFARPIVNLDWLWDIDMSKIQGFLKQSESASQIGHRVDTARGAQLLKNLCVAFAFRAFQKLIE